MSALRIFWARLRAVFSQRSAESRWNEEIASHLNEMAAAFEARGMTPEDARLAARREFGGVAQIQEELRERRGLPIAQTLAQDVRYALRQMRANPGFTAAAVLTFALGIGANTAIFRVLDAVVLRSLPVKNPQGLVLVQALQNGKPVLISYPMFREMAARQSALEGIFAGADVPAQSSGLNARLVTGAYFRVLGVRPAAGRLLNDADDRTAAPVAVISNGFSQRTFGSAASALGRVVTLNSVALTVVGVAPPRLLRRTGRLRAGCLDTHEPSAASLAG